MSASIGQSSAAHASYSEKDEGDGATASTHPASSGSERNLVGTAAQKSAQLEMTRMMLQSMERSRSGRRTAQPHYPSVHSLNSSLWSGYSSEASESYVWSSCLNSSGGTDDDDDDNDDSEYSSSLSGTDDSSDEDDSECESIAEDDPAPQLPVAPRLPRAPRMPPMPMEGLPIGQEGLPFSLESLKKDLEKVGRAILTSDVGGIAAERAQTLASINWLASHVPNAVLDQLGHEIRAIIEEEKCGDSKTEESEQAKLGSVVASDDAMSDVSDLSVADLNAFETDIEVDDVPTVNVPEVAGFGNSMESYGDLAHFSHIQTNSFLPELNEPTMDLTAGPSGFHNTVGMYTTSPTIVEQPRIENISCLDDYNEKSEESVKEDATITSRKSRRFGKALRRFSSGGSTHERKNGLSDQKTGIPAKSRYGLSDQKTGSSQKSRFRRFLGLDKSEHRTGSSHDGKSEKRQNLRKAQSLRTVSRHDNMEGTYLNKSDYNSKLSISERAEATRPSLGNVESSRNVSSGSDSVRGNVSRKSSYQSNDKSMALSEVSPKAKFGARSKKKKGPNGRHGSRDSFPETPTAVSTDESDMSQSLGGSSDNGAPSNDRRKRKKKDNSAWRTLPQAASYRCALLFADISGFTKLSTRLDPESLSKAINSYFQLIVNEVLDCNGDILKFAGDAVFIEWKATEEIDLEHCVQSAVNCAAKIIARCSDYSVLANGVSGGSSNLITSQAVEVDTLNVHCGIGAGRMIGVHVGDHKLRREYILLGQPIQQATIASAHATLGEAAVSPEAHSIMSRVCDLAPDIRTVGNGTPVVIANRKALKFGSKVRMGVHQPKIVNDVSRGVTCHVEGLEVKALRTYRRMMSLYVHPVVVDNDVAASNDFSSTQIKRLEQPAQARHREEAEIRKVYVMFVNPKIDAQVTRNEKENQKLYKQLNDIMNLSSREVKKFSGHLRQFIVDDKGLVLIITFGLRGTTIPNMVAQRALPATISLHNALQVELGMNVKVGATIGEAYCGVVGGVKRHEYAVLGPSVNLAARLMASETNPGILVDNRVRVLAHRSFGFNALPPVDAKGYADPVPIFEPLSPLERVWGRIQPNFVGRKDEIMTIMKMARDMVLAESRPKLVMIQSKSGMGKTTMVAHCIEHIRKLMGANKHRLIVTKTVNKESDSLIPFGIFRSILLRVLGSYRGSCDDKSQKSGTSVYSNLEQSISWESLSGQSVSQSSYDTTPSKSSDVLQQVCRELGMPPSFADYALYELLGAERKKAKSKSADKIKPPSPRTIISFLARAFKLCTQDAKLVVVALDDVHHTDEWSWKVIREIYETSHSVLFLATTYLPEDRELRVEEDFWQDLTTKYFLQDRYACMKLGCLNREEVTLMIMKTLGLQRKEVKEDVLEGVSIQSGGMPHFVNEILEHVKRQMAMDVDFEISDITYESFGDLVLQRLDSFDLHTRNALNIGAVIGLSFSLEDVVMVQMRMSDGQDDAVRKRTEESLIAAVEEGILEKVNLEDESESDDDDDEEKYAFYHAVWRTALLNLMLEGRKRDLHRMIAETMEEKDVGIGDYMFNSRLFHHWINSTNFTKAAELALLLGKHFEDRLGLPAQSIRLYTATLDLLREPSDQSTGTGVGGFSNRVLTRVGRGDLAHIIRLQVALGQALAMAQRPNESIATFQNALKITQGANSSRELLDRSILFPVFRGLSLAIKRGHIIQDEHCRYEQAMIRRYTQETKVHGDPIFIIHAIFLQAEFCSRFGEYERAIECQREIEPLYDPEEHSLDLIDEYGSDIAAQSFSNSALWYLELKEAEASLGTCWYVLEEIIPKIETKDVHTAFLIVYPVLWALKECGFALEAREAFGHIVCEAYEEYYGEGRSTFYLPLYEPILMLLDLSGNPSIDDETLEEYLDWAQDIDNLGFGVLINSKTGELGKTADSISAEICYLLSQRLPESDPIRSDMIDYGIRIATDDVEFTRSKNMVLAAQSTNEVLHCLERMR